MNPVTQTIILSASTLRMLPHIALFLIHRDELRDDLLKVQDRRDTVLNFIKACTREKTFRNLFYYRMGEYRSVFISWLMPPEKTLHIWCPRIGRGAHFEHNYATYLNARSIGRDFYCLQLVTLGNGFIITAMLWATALVAMIEGRTRAAAGVLLLCAGLTLFGVIHSVDPRGGVYLPWTLEGLRAVIAWQFAGAYAALAALLALLSLQRTPPR